MSSSASNHKGRILGLDGLRGLAILLVMLYHASLWFHAEGVWERALDTVLKVAWCGVDLFFVLSGFLITGILLRTKGSRSYFTTFYARRALRILPIYYAVLLVILILLPRLIRFDFAWFPERRGSGTWYWLFLSNFWIASTDGFHHRLLANTWSLAIEEQFYLFWPLLVLWLSSKRLSILCGAIVVLSPFLRAAALKLGLSPVGVYVSTPLRMDGLAAGALLATAMGHAGARAMVARWAGRAWQAGFLFLAALVVFLRWKRGTDSIALIVDPWMQCLGHSALVVLAGGLMIRAASFPASLWGRLFSLAPLRMLGKYSYAMYLLHASVFILVERLAFDDMEPTRFDTVHLLGFSIMGIGGTLLVSMVSWTLLEKPFRNLNRHFPYQIKYRLLQDS